LRTKWMRLPKNMSSRSGHVDVNERRLRPIYGQNTFTVDVTLQTYVLTPIYWIMIACFDSINVACAFVLCKSRIGPKSRKCVCVERALSVGRLNPLS